VLPIRLSASLLSPSGRRARLSILIYHRVRLSPAPIFPNKPDAEVFESQISALVRHFNVLPLSEAVERLRKNSLPARAACVTFDDGYADNAEIGLPILLHYGVTATFFIATDFLDGGRMWNDTVIEAVRRATGAEIDLSEFGLGRHEISTNEQRRKTIHSLLGALKYLSSSERSEKANLISEVVAAKLPDDLMMSSKQVQDLHAAGMEIGGHTASHPILARLEAGEARREIAQGKARLEEMIRAPIRLFAYPNGKPGLDYLVEHVKMVEQLGFIAAVSTGWGAADSESDIYQLPRFTPWEKSPTRFLLRLLRNQLRRSSPAVA
jgi:peptidoglycan/xylan/chitin deacetylase (PgdA/CDA1 family)